MNQKILLLTTLAIALSLPGNTGAAPLEAYPGSTLVPAEWADGDSFLVRLPDGREETFRLYYVDCPETDINRESTLERLQEQSAFFGIPNPVNAREAAEEAAVFTREILSERFVVHTSFAQAPSGGSGERYYAFIELADGSLLSEKLVAAGWARVSGKERMTPNGIHHEEQKAALEDLQLIAAVNRRGVWKFSDFTQLAELREDVRAKERDSAEFQAAAMGTTLPDPGEPLDLNTAEEARIRLLPQIGEVRAAAIVETRPFKSVDDLLEVDGIGPKTLEAIREYVVVSPAE